MPAAKNPRRFAETETKHLFGILYPPYYPSGKHRIGRFHIFIKNYLPAYTSQEKI